MIRESPGSTDIVSVNPVWKSPFWKGAATDADATQIKVKSRRIIFGN
jgi:hypothetical protein